MLAKFGKFGRIWSQGVLHGSSESFHSEKQRKNGCVLGSFIRKLIYFSSQYLMTISVTPFFLTFQSVREKPYPDEERVKGDPARDLAIVHHLCEANLQDLHSFARNNVSFCLHIFRVEFRIFFITFFFSIFSLN